MNSVVTVQIPGYAPGLAGSVPAVTDNGSLGAPETVGLRIPPVVWMFVFLVVGYVGLRMILDD